MPEAEPIVRVDKARLIGGCARLPLSLDSDRLKSEVAALPAEVWATTGERVGAHRDTGAVFLRGHAPAEGERPIADRPILDALPYCRELIEAAFGGEAQRCLLARLPGGRHVAAHSDVGPYFERTIRLHIPVATHARAHMLCGGLAYVMAEGEAWALNNDARHAVWNADPDRGRTHLICDFLPDARLIGLLERADRSLGREAPAVETAIAELTAQRRAARMGS